MLRSIGLGAVLLIGGCAPFVAAGVGGTAAIVAPQVPAWIAVAQSGVTVLSDGAKTACDIQALANLVGAATISRDAGFLCKW